MESTEQVITLAVSERRKFSANVLHGRYFQAKTPVTEEYALKFLEAIEMGLHGIIVYGLPRLGKTMASLWLLNAIRRLMGFAVPWLHVPVRDLGAFSDRTAFFTYLLSLMRHRHQNGSITDKRNRVTRWLLARAKRSAIAGFILFLDEAHVLPPRVFRWLLEIDNELVREDAMLIVLLVGQEELLTLRDRIAEVEGGEQFVERFMADEYPFRGLRSEAEYRQCLKNFIDTEYPQKSGISFGQHYIAELLATGYDITAVAPAMWSGLESLWKRWFVDEVELPMVHFTRCLLGLLNRLADRRPELALTEPTPEDVAYAVKRSGYGAYVERRYKQTLMQQRRRARAAQKASAR